MKADMKLISVNVGLPRVVMSNGEPVSTGIFKEPVAGRVMLRTPSLDGDRRLIWRTKPSGLPLSARTL
jgi:MOSC domain-containing protein YiiM